jgi:apolipoprotein N-acyltransferase
VSAGLWSGFALGLVSGALATPWIPGTMHGLGAPAANAAVGWFLVSAWGEGLPWAIFGAFAVEARRIPVAARILVLGLGAMLLDVLRAEVPGGLPWLLLGHSQAALRGVAQAAALGGVPLLSGLLVAVNAALAATATAPDRDRRCCGALVASGLLGGYAALALLGLPVAQALHPAPEQREAATLDVLIVQPDLAPGTRWSPLVQRTNLAIVLEQTLRELRAGRDRPDLVLWPETMLTQPIESDPELAKALREAVDRLELPLVLGAARSGRGRDASRYRNAALWVEPGRGVVDAIEKTRALPLVESARRFPGSQAVAEAMGLAPGRPLVEEGAHGGPLRGRFELAVAFCSEILHSALVHGRRSAASLAIVNLADDSWFADDQAARQMITIGSFRAIEERMWLLRAAQRGASAVIDPYGRVVAQLPFGQPGALRANVMREAAPAAGERLGLGGLFLAGGLIAMLLVRPILRRRSPPCAA